MKKTFAIALLLAAAGILPVQAQEKVLRIAMTASDIPTTSGMPNNGFEGMRFLGFPIFQGLIMFDLTTTGPVKLLPGLAEKWEQAADDKKTWIFHLRKGVKFHDGSILTAEDVVFSMERTPKHVYPSSVTLVEAASGKRLRLLSDIRAGQEGHADADEAYNVYLPNLPSRLETRAKIEENPRFREGENEVEDRGEFAVTDHSVGISVAYDPAYREAIVPHRGALVVYVTDSATGKQREINLREQLTPAELAWLNPTPDFLSGLAFHPDGKHLLSAGRDTVVRIWSLADGKLVKELGKPRGGQFKDWIQALSLSSDGTRLAAADMAGYVHVWQLGS